MTPDEQARVLYRQVREKWITHPEVEFENAMVSVVADALRASRPTWTDERPTEPGWYWVKSMYRKLPVVRVIEVKRWKQEHRRHGLYIYAARSIERCTKYQWARIEMPEDTL